MIRSSAIYSGLTLVSRLMGFVRDLVISYFLGASSNIAADALNTAQMFPNLFRRIFAEGAFAAAFVPAYSKSLDRDGPEIADRLAAMVPDQARGAAPEVEAAKAQLAKLAQALQAAGAKITALEQDRAHETRKLEIEAFEAETNRMRAMEGRAASD